MRHRNPYQKSASRGLVHFLLWQLGFYGFVGSNLHPPLPKDFRFPNPEEDVGVHDYICWINHSTYLVKGGGVTFLVDPIWNHRCSPFRFIGPKRQFAPPIAIESLPKIDYLILSHDHYDHLDIKSLKKITRLFPSLFCIVPMGLKAWFKKRLPKFNQNQILELAWWDSYTHSGSHSGETVTFTSVPAQHFSGRGLFDRNRSLWMGCVVEIDKTKKNFYFVGDTGYNVHDFKEIGEKFGPIDLSLIPIGAYLPRGFMKPVHVNPAEAVAIHEDVRSTLSVGGHFGTFKLSEEGLNRPPFDLYLALTKEGIPCSQFRVLSPGQKIRW